MRTKIGEKYYELTLGQAHSLLALFDTLRPEDRHLFEATAMKRFGVDLESCETECGVPCTHKADENDKPIRPGELVKLFNDSAKAEEQKQDERLVSVSQLEVGEFFYLPSYTEQLYLKIGKRKVLIIAPKTKGCRVEVIKKMVNVVRYIRQNVDIDSDYHAPQGMDFGDMDIGAVFEFAYDDSQVFFKVGENKAMVIAKQGAAREIIKVSKTEPCEKFANFAKFARH